MNGKISGKRLAHFLVGPIIGRGSIGTVYQAFDLNQDRPVALRVVAPHLARQTRFRRKFMQLGKTAVALRHPHIVPVFDVGRSEPHLYMAMALVDGISLGAALDRRPDAKPIVALPPLLRWAAHVADVLAFAHAQGVVHHAVKPDSLFLQSPDDGQAAFAPCLLADFGSAGLLSGVERARTHSLLRTLPYQSPEQVLLQPVDGRSDLYALGVVLYRLVTGRLPFVFRRSGDTVLKHLHELPRAPRLLHAGVPAPVDELIMRALAKRPQHRFQSGDEMAAALRACADELTAAQITAYENGRLVLTPAQLARVGQPDRLFISCADETTRILPLDKADVVIGRSRHADLVLSHEGVSRQHLRLQQQRDGWRIVDLGSTNGTFLDNERLTPHQPLSWPAERPLRVGPYWLRWQ